MKNKCRQKTRNACFTSLDSRISTKTAGIWQKWCNVNRCVITRRWKGVNICKTFTRGRNIWRKEEPGWKKVARFCCYLKRSNLEDCWFNNQMVIQDLLALKHSINALTKIMMIGIYLCLDVRMSKMINALD